MTDKGEKSGNEVGSTSRTPHARTPYPPPPPGNLLAVAHKAVFDALTLRAILGGRVGKRRQSTLLEGTRFPQSAFARVVGSRVQALWAGSGCRVQKPASYLRST